MRIRLVYVDGRSVDAELERETAPRLVLYDGVAWVQRMVVPDEHLVDPIVVYGVERDAVQLEAAEIRYGTGP